MKATYRLITCNDLAKLQQIGEDRAIGLEDWLQQKAFAGLLAYDHTNNNMLGYVIGISVKMEADIIDLVVCPAYRRKGIALSLITAFCDSFGTQRTYLEVARKNTPAYQLYLAAGFVEYGERKAYYQTADGTDDAIMMHKHGLK